MSSLYVRLLGGFQVRDSSGAPVGPLRPQAQAVLAVLALSPGAALPRDKLTALLWSERGDSQARSSLRHVLSDLRKVFDDFDPPPLIAERESIRIDPEAVEVDVTNFLHLIADGTPEALQRAAELYQGEFLAGLEVHDPAFEEWMRDERNHFHDCSREAIFCILEHQMAVGSTAEAATTARRLLSLDPLHEGAHRALMRIHADKGDRALALKQYQRCYDVLQSELGLEPEQETQDLNEEIRRVGRANNGSIKASTEPEPKEAASPSDRPSIVVCPFANLSGDPEQDYFSNGVTEDIITELSRFSVLEVIARNSTFTFRDRAFDLRKAGKALGARYMLEGSLRKAGNRIRLTAQLSDLEASKHIWAERYDRELADVFAIQDELVHVIVATLVSRVETADAKRSLRKLPLNLDAYDYYLRAIEMMRRFDAGNITEARKAVERAVALDPQFARAQALLAVLTIESGWLEQGNRDAYDDKALAIARKAIEGDPDDSDCHAAMGFVHLERKEFDEAQHFFDQAIALNPHYSKTWSQYAWYLIAIGEHEAALDWLSKREAIDPFPPNWHWGIRGLALYGLGRYEEANLAFSRMTRWNYWDHAYLAACYGQLGEIEKAQKHIKAYKQAFPEASLQYFAESENFFQRLEDFEPWLDGLRKAGLLD